MASEILQAANCKVVYNPQPVLRLHCHLSMAASKLPHPAGIGRPMQLLQAET